MTDIKRPANTRETVSKRGKRSLSQATAKKNKAQDVRFRQKFEDVSGIFGEFFTIILPADCGISACYELLNAGKCGGTYTRDRAGRGPPQ